MESDTILDTQIRRGDTLLIDMGEYTEELVYIRQHGELARFCTPEDFDFEDPNRRVVTNISEGIESFEDRLKEAESVERVRGPLWEQEAV